MKIAVFPGSFDPFTKGHEAIVRRVLGLFDKVIVAIGVNSEKKGYFSVEQRLHWIKEIFSNESKVEVASYTGLTYKFCEENNALFILRGLRNGTDFAFEKNIAQVNKEMHGGLETLFLLTDPEYSHVTSTIVREILKYGGDASKFLPEAINATLRLQQNKPIS